MSTAPSPVEPAPMNPFARLFGALFNPGETFKDIARRPSWIAPWLALTLTGLALSFALVQRADWEHVTRTQIEKNKFAQAQFEQLSPEQRERAYRQGAQRAKVFRYVRGAVGSLLLVLIEGGLYSLLFNVFGGADLSYKMCCTMVAYGALPISIRELLALPVLYLKDPLSIDPENYLASNLAAFLSDDAPLWQLPLAGSVDIFGIWAIILTAMGFAAANPTKVSFGKALAFVMGLTVFFVLLGTGIAALFS